MILEYLQVDSHLYYRLKHAETWDNMYVVVKCVESI
jgi:hypothetical protein